ncbi:MAG: ACP S-malonyltransferase [Armatimonadetes bacterium]|nr:ACP S-malonyltransferase [Armatimonadota bacterium]
MGKEVFDAGGLGRQVFSEVQEALQMDVAALCFESNAETLRRTDNAQIALFTVSVAMYRALAEAMDAAGHGPPRPVAMAGHSVGEYSALACAGVLSVQDGARLVRRRGDLMARAGALRPGGMAAVLGLDAAVVESACAEVSRKDHEVVTANYNCPGQLVISGDRAAVDEACGRLKESGAKRCMPLNVSGAFHSPLMGDAAAAMGEALRRTSFYARPGTTPVISNVAAEPVSDPDGWPALLERQLLYPVRWEQSVRRAIEMGAELFMECGPGEVLSGLLKRIDSGVRSLAVQDPDSVAEAVSAVGGVPA